MENMQNYTLGELADIYDQATPEEKKWMSDNIGERKRKTRMKYHSG